MAARGLLSLLLSLAAIAVMLVGTEAFLGVPVGSNSRVQNSRMARFAVEKGEALKKGELVDLLVEETGVTKVVAQKMLTALTDVIASSLVAGKKVNLASFGTFSTNTRAARTGRNPRTGESLQLPETTVVSFAPSKTLKDKLNQRG